MEKPGKHNKAKIILSLIATAIGLILVITKTYSYIGIILLSFGGLILQYSLGARKKEITTDELTEWISGKSANISFWATYSIIVLLLAIDIYSPDFFKTYIALGIVLLVTAGVRVAGEYYYGKISKKVGF
ncbi:hypothetical protein [Candidatus Methanoperedens nitratireducens]|uniref:DUF2178 domain-containing protein n=1 Tax=Candidatus Methanoperedens nitratireducens TaxID=1392998 RepID=A0A284VPW6_9EURY|nr:hypothetical protein [Candidatus Methanoperedens nitroreducens]SNQ61324.1 membrane hypothetical protein [Candidatus Methanoperedens nitroreducens]